MNWKTFTIASDGTHHLDGQQPVYEKRFDEVLKFHEPGLAPVRLGDKAWHIEPSGRAAYQRQFQRTFGFYEGQASVVSENGWHHIIPSGDDLYSGRNLWCGNFQGGRCTVRGANNQYWHIDFEGKAAYLKRWSYAGDFKDGIAVVQGNNGFSTHINKAGELLHNSWFLDLDIFHKNFARAKDEDGWTHIDKAGRPLYARRFVMVEPFYNGQSRVERFDGGLEVIDEHGQTITELRPARRSEFAKLSADLVSFWKTQAIGAAVSLGVFEQLPSTSTVISNRLSLDPERTERLLKALGELALIERTDTTWRATKKGAFLQRSHPLSLVEASEEYAYKMSNLWVALPDALRTNSSWKAPDIFGQVATNPQRTQDHHKMLASYAEHDYPCIPEALALRGNEAIIDAAGGVGILSRLLLRQYPNVRVTLLERPEVIQMVKPIERLALHPGDIFQPWGLMADAVVLSRILHDWDDEPALCILRNAYEALAPGGYLFVVEMPLPENGFSGALCDLHLLMVTGGKERTVSAYRELFSRTGFELQEVRRTQALPSILVGVKHGRL